LIENNVYDNSGNKKSGMVLFDNDTGIFRNNILRNNNVISNSYSSVLSLYNSNLSIVGNLIHDNKEKVNAIYFYNSSPEVVNNTFISNEIPCVDLERYSNPTFINSNILGSGSLYDGKICNILLDNSKPLFYNCNIEGGRDIIKEENNTSPFDGIYIANLDVDPQFVSSGSHPYRLRYNSSCINAGKVNLDSLSLSSYDLRGRERIYDGRIDIGAYEYSGQAYGEPIIGFDIEKMDFGNLQAGASLDDTLIIYNHGNSPIDIEDIRLKESIPGFELNIIASSKGIKKYIAPHSKDSIKVTFNPEPGKIKYYDNEIVFLSSQTTDEVSVKLFGKGFAGTIIVQDLYLVFGKGPTIHILSLVIFLLKTH